MTNLTREALDAVGAGAFVQKRIDPIVVDIQQRYAPFLAAIPTEKWDSDIYNFNRRTALPSGGWVRDGGARPVTNGTYDQKLWQMKHLEAIGDVTGYAEEVTKAQAGSIRGREVEGAYKGLAWDLETAIIWGNADATVNGPDPHFSGLDAIVADYSGSGQNSVDVNGAFSLGQLDILIDLVEQNLAESVDNSGWMFACSSTAIGRAGQLLQAQSRYETVEIAAGLNVLSYRNIPLVKSSFLAPRSIKMGAVTGAASGVTGGTVTPSSTFIYKVSAVINRSGETIACDDVTVTTSTGAQVVDLSFSVPAGYQGATPLLYKVFRSTAGGASSTCTLIGTVDAQVALNTDNVTRIPTTKIRDTGAALVPMNGSTTPTVTPTAYTGANASRKPLAAQQENVYLVPRSRDYMLRPFVRDMKPLPVSTTVSSPDSNPFAVISDTVLAVRDPRAIGRLDRVTVALS
jgi:hypothetical protein